MASKMNIGMQILGSRVLSRRYPLAVGWKLLNRCNQSCLYCDSRNQPCDELPIERIIELIREIKRAGAARISYTGGEPLLHEHIGSILRETRACAIKSTLNTNGQLIPERICDIESADRILISYDGPEKVHDELRGKNTHHGVLRAIDSVRRTLGERVELRCVLTAINVSKIDEILEFSSEMKLPIGFSIVQEFPFSSSRVPELLPEREELRDCMRCIIEAKKRRNSWVSTSAPALEHLAKWPEDTVLPCATAKLFCRIDSQGDIMSCGKYADTRGSLNCRNHDFLDAFKSLKFVQCGQCWCGSKVDLNLIYALNVRAILARRYDS